MKQVKKRSISPQVAAPCEVVPVRVHATTRYSVQWIHPQDSSSWKLSRNPSLEPEAEGMRLEVHVHSYEDIHWHLWYGAVPVLTPNPEPELHNHRVHLLTHRAAPSLDATASGLTLRGREVGAADGPREPLFPPPLLPSSLSAYCGSQKNSTR